MIFERDTELRTTQPATNAGPTRFSRGLTLRRGGSALQNDGIDHQLRPGKSRATPLQSPPAQQHPRTTVRQLAAVASVARRNPCPRCRAC